MRYFIDLAVYNKLDLHAFWQMEFGLDAWSELQANADMHCERMFALIEEYHFSIKYCRCRSKK
jgi:hypothetical protein